MNSISKFEVAGIFASVAVMAIALALINFKSEKFTNVETTPQVGSVVVARENATPQEVEDALRSASKGGSLEKLVINDIKIGSGKAIEDGDTVVVNYVGRTQNGVEFDSSYKRGEPYEFVVGSGKVIEGWERGLVGMKEGGERILVIPPLMAYGNAQVGPIPPNSTLVFSIELLRVK